MAIDVSKMKEITKQAFQSVADPNDQDAVMGEMFTNGIPFGKLKSLHKTIGIEFGFIVDPAVIRENIDAEFDSAELAFADWSSVEDFIDEVVENVDGSDADLVLRRLRAYCKTNDIEIPEKPRSAVTRKPGVGKIAGLVLDYASKYKEPTRTGLYDYIRPEMKSDKNAYDTVNLYFPVMFGVKNGLNAEDTLEALQNVPLLEKPEDNNESEENSED